MDSIRKIIYVAVLMSLISCASPPADTRTLGLIESVLGEAIKSNQEKPTAPSQQDIQSALIPPININIPGHSDVDLTARFDLKVNRVIAREFFMGLVQDTGYNMVVHPKVKGHITLDLKNITIDEVMEVVRNVYGYDYERTEAAYHVYPDELRTRIFKVDYLDVKRSGSSEMRVSSGQITQTSLNNADGAANIARENVAGSSINTVNESNFWAELRQTLATIVGNSEGHNVVVSPQSGIVVVRARSEQLRAVEHFLNTTQDIVQRQVLLEAKILEVALSDRFQAGINWAGVKDSGNDRLLIGQTGGGGGIFDSGTSIIGGNAGVLDPDNRSQPSTTNTSAFGGVFTAALNIGTSFTAFIELLKSQGDVQVLSSPQVATVNNQKAVIKVGTDEFFVTDVATNTNTATSTTSTENDVELTPFFSGVALDVIPQISANKDIILHVHPTVVDVVERVKNISVSSTTTLSVPLAVSSIRESDTIIRAKNGQVVVIGGLMINKTDDQQAKVPLLGDIPVVGNLFKHRRDITRKSELVILLKPTVIEGPRQWANKMRETLGNIRSMYNLEQ